MSIITGYYNSLNSDRRYNAETMSKYFVGLISKGVLQNYKNKFIVSAFEGMKVKVPTGKAYFSDGKWLENTADITLTIDNSDVVLNRVDRIVLRNDKREEAREGTIVLKKGVPASNPVPPELENNDYVEELSLATIRIDKLVETITQANITNTIPDNSVCGYVTGLIHQVDTSDLYSQYESAYETFRIESEKLFNNYMQTSEKDFDDYMMTSKEKFDNYMQVSKEVFDNWFLTIKDTFSTATLIRQYTNNVKSTQDNQSVFEIGIPQYEPVLDILNVYINSMLLIEGKDYTKTATTISLTLPVDIDQDVYFLVLKSVDGEKAITVIEQVEDLIARVTALENK